jgi:hypothetical protein
MRQHHMTRRMAKYQRPEKMLSKGTFTHHWCENNIVIFAEPSGIH